MGSRLKSENPRPSPSRSPIAARAPTSPNRKSSTTDGAGKTLPDAIGRQVVQVHVAIAIGIFHHPSDGETVAPARGDAGLGIRQGTTKGLVVKQVDISATVNVPTIAWVVTGTGSARRETALKNGEVGKVHGIVRIEIAEPAPLGANGSVALIDAADGRAIVGVDSVDANAHVKATPPPRRTPTFVHHDARRCLGALVHTVQHRVAIRIVFRYSAAAYPRRRLGGI